jgi:acetyl-CoA C-acetyltransferase
VTIDRQCGSSQQAVHFAAQAVMSGTADLVIAGGVQTMSQIPIGAAMIVGQQFGHPHPMASARGWIKRYGDQPLSQFRSANMIAEKWNLTRAEMEEYALESHRRAIAARDKLAAEILPLADCGSDEGPRADTTLEKMATLKALEEGSRITAATASQISDGAAALLIASEAALKLHNLVPRARIHHISVRGADPVWMLTAPIPATQYALARTGLSIRDIDAVEINEAFASVVMAWLKETGCDPARVNPCGGAIALGHPLGATGARLMTTLLGELERRNGRYGLQTMCEGGGQANVTIVERVS